MKDSSGYSNVRKNVQYSLAADLQNLSTEFRKKQSSYFKQLRQQKEGQDGFDLEMNINGSKSTFELQDDEFEDVVVESVNELAQIMKDLSVFVTDGTIVDRIDQMLQLQLKRVRNNCKRLRGRRRKGAW